MSRVTTALLGILLFGSACSRPASAEATASPSTSGAPAAGIVAPAVRELYEGVLRDHVSEGRVDYAALKTDPRLAAYLDALARTDLASFSRDERLAYWINTYNAATLKLMADAWPVESIMKLNGGKPWDVPLFTPHGAVTPLTLNALEHGIIRKEFGEPRIHFALVCAAVSCPPLISEPYVAATLDAQLERQTRAFLRDPSRNRYDAASHTLRLSPLFDWYAVDFGGAAGVPAYVRPFLSEADRNNLAKTKRAPAVQFGDYDWAPNAVK